MGKRIPALARAIEARFPGTTVWVKPYRSPDGDPEKKWYLRILNCPARLTPHAQIFGIRLALRLWGLGRVPLFIGAVNRRHTREYFGHVLASPRRPWSSYGRSRPSSARNARRRLTPRAKRR
ncbi:MAG: hypothetical protein L0323_02820 [Planctomycetes bacterium]|nr:hypothetical protein [Planctomycetota bacterium]